MQTKQVVIGLTGLLGSGKSTVADIFSNYGVRIIDTDKISYQLTKSSGAVMELIADTFGNKFIDDYGGLRRDLMRDLVFSDSKSRRKLEQILHPQIFAQVIEQLSQINEAPYTIIVVPLLFANPEYLTLIKRSIFVDAEYETIVQRVMLRSKLTKKQIDNILATQLTREQQLEQATNVDLVHNNDNLITLKQQVEILHSQYLLLAKRTYNYA